MDEYEIFEFLEAEDAEEKELKRRRRKRMREEANPFELADAKFVKRYRLSKELVRNLIEDLKPLMKKPYKTTDISVETKVLTALSFYATSSNQLPLGSIKGQAMAQPTVSTIISQVTTSLNNLEMHQKYIKFPTSDKERQQVKEEFYKRFGIPGVLGCIDCTHVAIIRPSVNEKQYFYPKPYHCLNVQLVCDANMQILSIDASHGGASSKASIWSQNLLKDHLETLSNTDNIYFLGDNAYPLRKTMMTPILNGALNTPEAYYNNLHYQASSVIKQTIRLLKARFRCLHSNNILHYSPEVASNIVNACVVLHNICNAAKCPMETEPLSDEEAVMESQSEVPDDDEQTDEHDTAEQLGWESRNCLIKRLWESHEKK